MKDKKFDTLKLIVEVFGGSPIRQVAIDLCDVANRVGVLCEANFNDVRLWARPGNDPATLVEAYQQKCDEPSPFTNIAQVKE